MPDIMKANTKSWYAAIRSTAAKRKSAAWPRLRFPTRPTASRSPWHAPRSIKTSMKSKVALNIAERLDRQAAPSFAGLNKYTVKRRLGNSVDSYLNDSTISSLSPAGLEKSLPFMLSVGCFNPTFRKDTLDASLVDTLKEVRKTVEPWIKESIQHHKSARCLAGSDAISIRSPQCLSLTIFN